MSRNIKKDKKTIKNDLELTMQQKFDFESASFKEEDTKVLYKKNRKKNYERSKREKELVILKNKYKKKYNAYMTLTVLLSMLLICVIAMYIIVKPKVITKTVEKKINVVPENIVFLGDSITEQYDLEKYYDDYNIVNSGISGNTTDDILGDMYNRVYKYNPSKVFLLIGTNDINKDKSNEEIINNIESIIEQIKEKRPYCQIYLESIYPINNTDNKKIGHGMVDKRNNETIKQINKGLKKYCKSKKITYIDMYTNLEDSEGNLNINFTKEGLHISDEGYEKITKELLKYM